MSRFGAREGLLRVFDKSYGYAPRPCLRPCARVRGGQAPAPRPRAAGVDSDRTSATVMDRDT